MMGETGDWSNLTPFLEGLNTAKRKLTSAQWAKVIRRVSMAGRSDVALDIMRRASKTGIQLRTVGLVREAMWSAHSKAAQSKWDANKTAKALKMAEQVAQILDDPIHLGGQKASSHDPRAQPDVIGVLLELAAAKAVKHHDGQDIDGKVELYATKLMTRWSDSTLSPIKENANRPVAASNELCRWVPMCYGMKLAGQVLHQDSPATKWIRNNLSKIEKHLKDARDLAEPSAEGKIKRGVAWHNELLG
jgi:hypothetical protein